MTPMQAIKAKCTDCIYDAMATGTRTMQIENCLDTSCPLHEHRPITSATKAKHKEKRINAMSDDERQAYNNKAEIARKRFAKTRGMK